MRTSLAHALLLFWSINLVGMVCLGQTAQQPGSGAPTPALNELLSWLPADTETVVGLSGPFPAPDLRLLEKLGNDVSPDRKLSRLELDLRTETLGLGLLGFRNGGLQDILKNYMVARVIEGSRRFRSPATLGEMRYEGCEIAILSGSPALDWDAFMKNAAASSKRVEDVEGTKVAVFEEESEDDTWTTFVGFPRAHTVVIATDIDYLRTVLSRMKTASGTRALPETLPEWKYVNVRAPAWGLRHYQRLATALDPTSPFHAQDAANIPDTRAIGAAFWFEPGNTPAAHVFYLSSNADSRQILQDHLGGMADAATASPRELQVRLNRPAPGVVEGRVELSGPEIFYQLLFCLAAMLGHAVYL